MKKFISSLVLAVIAFMGITSTPNLAEAGNRSFYGRPTFHKNFHVRHYNFFSNHHKGFRQHHAYYFNNSPKHVYFFNPHKNQWWGRYDLEVGGYSLLKEADRKANLSDIAEGAFPKPGKMPSEEQGGETMDVPPPFAKETTPSRKN